MGVYLQNYKLIWDKNNNNRYASYCTFYIGGSTTDYTPHVSGYSGRDSLSYHNLLKVTTKDNDNDLGNWGSSDFTGAWWYSNCYYSNLNGRPDLKFIVNY